MELISPKPMGQTRAGPFAQLLLSDRQMKRAHCMFTTVLAKSFEEDRRRKGDWFVRRIQTRAEMKRRGQIVARWFRVFRGELGYSLSKCEIELGRALRSELDETIYTPAPAGRAYGQKGDIS